MSPKGVNLDKFHNILEKIMSYFIHNVNLLGKNKATINKTTHILRSEILMAVLHEIQVFWNVTLC
jgi:hypothetical protein